MTKLTDAEMLEAIADNRNLPFSHMMGELDRLESLGLIKSRINRPGSWTVTAAGLDTIRAANSARITRPELEV